MLLMPTVTCSQATHRAMAHVMQHMLADLLDSSTGKTGLFGYHAPDSPPTQASFLQLCPCC